MWPHAWLQACRSPASTIRLSIASSPGLNRRLRGDGRSPPICQNGSMRRPHEAAIFSRHDAIDGKVEDVEAPQIAARSPFGIRLVQRIIQNERDTAFGDAAM